MPPNKIVPYFILILNFYCCRCWSVDFNSVDTKLLASGSDDARVKLWSANINHSVASLEAKVNYLSQL